MKEEADRGAFRVHLIAETGSSLTTYLVYRDAINSRMACLGNRNISEGNQM